MAKALIVFSDGTGNKGGVTHDTNVWRLYQMIDRTAGEQLTFYDDGVGTQNFAPLKALSGALGVGLSRNIRQAYAFLVKNYDPGDKIYMFGFSRGAFTVRSLLGMLNTCGLAERTDATEKPLSSAEIDTLVCKTFQAYRSINRDEAAKALMNNPKVAIEFLGVWDTVDAVGLPFDNLSYPLLKLLYGIFNRRPYGFTDQVINGTRFARQALAIDDERLTFHPNYWKKAGKYTHQTSETNETEEGVVDLKQVWFSGAHSNCGGSYPKDGLAYITLDWMLSELPAVPDKDRGAGNLRLRREDVARVRDLANDGDNLYDPREGFGSFYRYAPRKLKAIAKKGPRVQVHTSVLSRIKKRAENYAPLFINQTDRAELHTIDLAFTCNQESRYRKENRDPDFNDFPTLSSETTDELTSLVRNRKRSYWVFMILTLIGILAGLVIDPTKNWTNPRSGEVVLLANGSCSPIPSQKGNSILVTLRKNTCATVSLDAQKKNRTGIWIEKGMTYQFELSKVEGWKDGGAVSSPKFGRKSESSAVEALRATTYESEARYMELIGLVDGKIFRLGEMSHLDKIPEDLPKDILTYPNKAKNYVAEASGELVVFTNEPIWSAPWLDFFKNNTGTADLKVTTNIHTEEKQSRIEEDVLSEAPERFRPWVASVLKSLLPAAAERIIDNSLSFPTYSVFWILTLVFMWCTGRLYKKKINRKARQGWDRVLQAG